MSAVYKEISFFKDAGEAVGPVFGMPFPGVAFLFAEILERF